MKNSVESGKSIAITSYILIVGVLIALSMNADAKNPFASFHIRQSLGLSITFISLGLVVSNFNDFMLTTAMWVFVSVLWGYGLVSAIKGETKPLPLLGTLFQSAFKSIS
ncbi:MAG: hypothetical protein RLZ77_193 [Bacteroidota bacterium]|jgi:uncharacterized membrane protein